MFQAIKLVILFTLVLESCKPHTEELKKGWWKYADGFHAGDVLIFTDSNLNGDTILKNKNPVAIIIRGDSHDILIRSIASGEEGRYVHK